jgi:hypothetical protein
VRGLVLALGRPLIRNALALCVALGIPAAILFSSNGLRAKDVVTLAHHSLLARGLLWLAWLALSAPALHVLFEAPGSRTLRALRVPRAALVCALFLLASVTQLPWALLFARGGGLVAAWAAVTLALGLSASALVALRRPRWALLLALGAALLAADLPPLVVALVGSVWAPCALHAGWSCALEQPSARWRLMRPTHPLLALYAAHALGLARAARSRLLVALVSGVGGALGLAYSLRNDPTERPVVRALAALALPLTLGAAACVAPLLESEARLRWLLRSLRVPRAFVLSAFLLAVATPSSALAATTGIALSTAAHTSMSALGAALLGWALALSCAVAAWGRFLEWRARRSAGAFAAGVTLIAALALLLALSW